MGLLRKIDEVMATVRYYRALTERYAAEAQRNAHEITMVETSHDDADDRAMAA